LAAGSLNNKILLTDIKGAAPFSQVAVPAEGPGSDGVRLKGTSAGNVPFFYCLFTRLPGGFQNAR